MRKVVSSLFISLDGVVEEPHDWQFDFDAEMGDALTAEQNKQDTLLLGRVTYQMWEGYWPTADPEIDFTAFANDTPKYVASTTLDRVEWQNSTLIKGSLADEVARLKREPGKDIGIYGSPSVVRSLLYDDLLDELLLLVHPVVAGSGKRLFPEGSGLKRLELLDATRGGSGSMIVRYGPRTSSE
jgi:dihydrofolate reductase